MAVAFLLQQSEERLHGPSGFVDGSRTPSGFYLTNQRVIDVERPAFGALKVQAFNLENIDSLVTETRMQPALLMVALVFAVTGLLFLGLMPIAAWACWAGAVLLLLTFVVVRRRILLVHSGRTTIRRELNGDANQTRRLVDLIQEAKQARLSQHGVPERSSDVDDIPNPAPVNEYAHSKYVEVRALFRLREEGLLTEAEYEESKRAALGLGNPK